MKILEKFFAKLNGINFNVDSSSSNDNKNYNYEQNKKYIEERINEFEQKYDLSSIEGIRLIPVQEAERYSDGGISVAYMPEQILNRKATEYKKDNKLDLAIECLRKANELFPLSFYSYTRNNYERLVDFMVLAGKYSEAKKEHHRLNNICGTRLDELYSLQDYAVQTNVESKEEYQVRIIDPYIEESMDREQYYWLLENLKELAPKSFNGYRRIKKLNSSSYQKILNELKVKGKDIDNLKFWD